MNRLANTVGDRINQFDDLEWFDQTIETFNSMFPECPIKDEGNIAWIEIGEVAPNNCRMIKLYEQEDTYTTIQHKMYSDMLYTLDREFYRWDERDLELDEINGVPV
jgi:hypothetical protein